MGGSKANSMLFSYKTNAQLEANQDETDKHPPRQTNAPNTQFVMDFCSYWCMCMDCKAQKGSGLLQTVSICFMAFGSTTTCLSTGKLGRPLCLYGGSYIDTWCQSVCHSLISVHDHMLALKSLDGGRKVHCT